jgi:tetratricopeptide (TPR) repeat protein
MMLCLFMGILGTTWQAIVANAEREAAQAETRRAVRAERRAESNFKLAQNAADQMLTRLGEDRLKHVPHAEQIRRELLQDALELFNGLAHKESMLIFRELTRRFPENKTYQHELSISLKATGELRSSLEVLNKLIAMHPEDAELRETEMAVYAALASIHSSAGQREKAIEYFTDRPRHAARRICKLSK